MDTNRTNKREVKLRRNNEFEYEGSLNFLTSRNSSSSNNTRGVLRHSSSYSEAPSVVTYNSLEGTAINLWSNIDFLPSDLSSNQQLGSFNPSNSLSYCIPIPEGSRSLGQNQNTLSGSPSIDSELCYGIGGRSHSSTRFDFLDLNSILSVSPTVSVDT